MKIDDHGRVLTNIIIIVCVVVAALGGLIYLGSRYTEGMNENAHAFFQNLSEKEIDAAYALTSKEFQTATTLAQLTERSQGFDKIKIEWGEEHRAGENRKKIDIVFINPNGDRAPISLTMVRQDDEWKVQAVDPRETEEVKPEEADEKEERLPGYSGLMWSTARITEAFTSNELSHDTSKRSILFTQDSDKIYCMVHLANAPDNTDVSAQWIFVGDPENALKEHVIATNTIESKGHEELNFYLIHPDKEFPKGKYLVKLFINGKKKKEIPFAVK